MKLLCLIITFPNPWSMKLTELNEKLCEPWEYKGNLMKETPDFRITRSIYKTAVDRGPAISCITLLTNNHISAETN